MNQVKDESSTSSEIYRNKYNKCTHKKGSLKNETIRTNHMQGAERNDHAGLWSTTRISAGRGVPHRPLYNHTSVRIASQ